MVVILVKQSNNTCMWIILKIIESYPLLVADCYGRDSKFPTESERKLKSFPYLIKKMKTTFNMDVNKTKHQ